MKKIKFIFTLILAVAIIYSCDRKKGLLPVDVTPPPPPGFCDTITYAKHIQAILTSNCATMFCHNATTMQSGYDLSNYATCKAIAVSGRLKARAIDAALPGPMPAVGLVPQAQRDLIQCWINNGQKP